MPWPWNAAAQGASCPGGIIPKQGGLVVGNGICKFSSVNSFLFDDRMLEGAGSAMLIVVCV